MNRKEIKIEDFTCNPIHQLATLNWLAYLSVSNDTLGMIKNSISEDDFVEGTVLGDLGIALSNCKTLDAVSDMIYDIEGLTSTLLKQVSMESGEDIEDYESLMSSILHNVNDCFVNNIDVLSDKETDSFNLDGCAICLNASGQKIKNIEKGD